MLIAINEIGRRVGQSHPQAKLTDRDVDLMLTLRALNSAIWTYDLLAEKFEVSKSQVRNICLGRKRCQFPTDWKVIQRVSPDAQRIKQQPFKEVHDADAAT